MIIRISPLEAGVNRAPGVTMDLHRFETKVCRVNGGVACHHQHRHTANNRDPDGMRVQTGASNRNINVRKVFLPSLN